MNWLAFAVSILIASVSHAQMLPTFPRHAAHNLVEFTAMWEAAKNGGYTSPGHPLELERGYYYVDPFVMERSKDLRDGELRGNNATFLVPSNAGPSRVYFDLTTHIASVKEGLIRDFRIDGQNTNRFDYLFGLTTYAVALKNVYVERSQQGGILLTGQQHYTLDHVHTTYCDVGITLDDVFGAHLTNCRGEACRIGLLITNCDRARPVAVVDSFYAERSDVGVELRGVSGCEVRNVFSGGTAVRVTEGATANLIDAHGSHGGVVLDEGTQFNRVLFDPSSDHAVVDNGRNECIPIGQAAFLSGEEIEPMPSPVTLTPPPGGAVDTHTAAWMTIDADSTRDILIRIAAEPHIKVTLNLFDLRSRQWYDFAGNWGASHNQIVPADVGGDVFRFAVDAGSQSRQVRVRVYASRRRSAPRGTATISAVEIR